VRTTWKQRRLSDDQPTVLPTGHLCQGPEAGSHCPRSPCPYSRIHWYPDNDGIRSVPDDDHVERQVWNKTNPSTYGCTHQPIGVNFQGHVTRQPGRRDILCRLDMHALTFRLR
jgi:hypothetical protein